jgi:hypothetical protein
MAKPDYNKVEAALEEGLLRMRAQELAKIAEFYQKPSKGAQYLRQRRERLEHWSLLKELLYDLNKIHKLDREGYKSLSINRKKVREWIEHFDDISEEEWDKIEEAEAEVYRYKKRILKEQGIKDSEHLPGKIQDERAKEENRRFKVRDGWLPLQ